MQKQFLIFPLKRGLELEHCLHADCSFLSSILLSLQNLERHGDNTASEKGMLDLTLFYLITSNFSAFSCPCFSKTEKKRDRDCMVHSVNAFIHIL